MRLLLIEDDPDISRELLLRWRDGAWVVRHAGTLAQADAALAEDVPDLLLLDLGLPDGDGLSWLQAFRRVQPDIPVLILTARDRVAERVQGLRCGADDYLVKPYAPEELDARIAVLLRRLGQLQSRSHLHRYGPVSIETDPPRAYLQGQPFDMPPRELEVLHCLIRRAPRLVGKGDLVQLLAASNLEVNDTVAELYVSRLRRRLAGSGLEIRTIRGVGYQLAMAPAASRLEA